jgi:hypothetical protein
MARLALQPGEQIETLAQTAADHQPGEPAG